MTPITTAAIGYKDFHSNEPQDFIFTSLRFQRQFVHNIRATLSDKFLSANTSVVLSHVSECVPYRKPSVPTLCV